MKPNVTPMDAILRITCGLFLLTLSSSKLHMHCSLISIIGIILGAMKTAEGIVRFCPIIYMKERMRIETKKQDHKQDGRVINPS